MTLTEQRNDLAHRWTSLLEAEPRLRIRDAAARLGVSELELLLVNAGDGVTPLDLDFETFLPRLESLGRVMPLTRNDHCVIETKGSYTDAAVHPHASQVLAPGVDLRIFQRHWVHLVAVEKQTERGTRRSLQVFDAVGEAVHKIHLLEGSNVEAWKRIVDDLRSDAEFPGVPPAADDSHGSVDNSEGEAPGETDREGLLQAWSELEHTHDFFRLMGRFNVTRTQALEIAEGRYTRRLAPNAIEPLLSGAAERTIPIMAFVGNRGTIQIHSGRVERIVESGDWFNVMDPDFNLHLDRRGVAAVWAVTKPTSYGPIQSVELYTDDGDQIVSVFGLRKGDTVVPGWTGLVAELPSPA